MNKGYEVEFCNLELRFDRWQIQNLIRELIQDGYSLYWSESDGIFMVSIRTGRRLLKLHFQQINDRFKMVGDYTVRDEKLTELLEKLINSTRGHAVVKKIKDRQIVIESFMFGEVIRQVEVTGLEQRVIFQKKPAVTTEDMIKAFQSKRAEKRATIVRLEVDRELSDLYEAMLSNDRNKADSCKKKLEQLRIEMLQLEL